MCCVQALAETCMSHNPIQRPGVMEVIPKIRAMLDALPAEEMAYSGASRLSSTALGEST